MAKKEYIEKAATAEDKIEGCPMIVETTGEKEKGNPGDNSKAVQNGKVLLEITQGPAISYKAEDCTIVIDDNGNVSYKESSKDSEENTK